jgi:hypothetical protein
MNPQNKDSSLDFNPHLDAQGAGGSKLHLDAGAAKGRIEQTGPGANLPWQTRLRPPTSYENALGGALEHVFEGGATNLEEVVAALNASSVKTPEGAKWTAHSYEATMARLDPSKT